MQRNFNNLNIEKLKEWVNAFHLDYEFKKAFSTESNEEIILGNRDNKVCRFCGKDESKTTFKNKAHVIPAFLGNIFYKSYYECDECNKIFGEYENDLSSFIGLRGFLEQSDNIDKKRRRVFKKPGSKAEMYPSKIGIVIRDTNNEIFEEIEKGKWIKSKIYKNPYIPLYVYKSLVKMSLSVLPNEIIGNYKKTFEFIRTEKYDDDIVIKKFALLSNLWLSGLYMNYPMIYTYKKSSRLKKLEIENNIRKPDKTYVIFFKDLCFQIFIPYDSSDYWISDIEKHNVLFTIYPLLEFLI